MQRQRRRDYRTPAYPTQAGQPDRRTFLRQLGLLAGAGAVAAASSACRIYPPLSGEIAYPEELRTVRLPLLEAGHTLYFDKDGQLDYAIEVTVMGWDLAAYLEENAEGLLDLCDEQLSDHDFAELSADAELAGIEQQLLQVIADAYRGQPAAPLDGFQALRLVIVDRQIGAAEGPAH